MGALGLYIIHFQYTSNFLLFQAEFRHSNVQIFVLFLDKLPVYGSSTDGQARKHLLT